MPLRDLLLDHVESHRMALPRFRQLMTDDGYSDDLIWAISEESRTTLQYLASLARSKTPEELFKDNLKAAMLTRLNYINNTHAADQESPVNILSSQICRHFNLRFILRIPPGITENQSIRHLRNGFARYKIQLVGTSLDRENWGERSYLLRRAIESKDTSAVKYLICLEKDVDINWFMNTLSKYLNSLGQQEEVMFLIDQLRAISTFWSPRNPEPIDLFDNFPQLCIHHEIYYDEDMISFYAEQLVVMMSRNPFPNPRQQHKINRLNHAIATKNTDTIIKALHLRDDPTYLLTPSLPEAVVRMPQAIKNILEARERPLLKPRRATI